MHTARTSAYGPSIAIAAEDSSVVFADVVYDVVGANGEYDDGDDADDDDNDDDDAAGAEALTTQAAARAEQVRLPSAV